MFCPQCGAQYRVLADALDSKVQCRQCHRTFFPKVTAGKRPRKPDYTKAYLGFGGLAVFVVLSFVLLKATGGSEPARAKTNEPPKKVETGTLNPRVQHLMGWADKVARNDTFGIREGTDLVAVQQLFEVEPGVDYRNAAPERRKEIEDAILGAFQSHEKAKYLRDLRCTHGQLVEESMADSDRGQVKLYLVPEEGDERYVAGRGRAEIVVDFVMEGSFPKVTGWTVTRKAPERYVPTGDVYIPHDKIAKPEVVERDFGGQKIEVTESEPVPLEHLEDTPPELRQEIDKLVQDVLESASPTAPGALFNRATDRLVEIGRPAVPRLLNALYELHGDPIGNNIQLSQVCRCLRQVSGNAYDYPVADRPGESRQQTTEKRVSAVKQWYAWWYKYHKGEYDLLIDKRENLEEPLDEPGKSGPDKKK